jgi:hypothetical protein
MGKVVGRMATVCVSLGRTREAAMLRRNSDAALVATPGRDERSMHEAGVRAPPQATTRPNMRTSGWRLPDDAAIGHSSARRNRSGDERIIGPDER